MTTNGRKPRPMLLGDRVHLLGQDEGSFKDFAVLGTVTNRGLAVVMLCGWETELAPVYAYPAPNLKWDNLGQCWTGPLPQDRSALVLPR